VADEVDIFVTDVEVEDQPPTYPSTASHSRNLRSGDKPTHIEEEVDVKETITIEEKGPKFWRTLLTGIPSPTSSLLSLLTLLLNVGLILAATDFIYRGKLLYPSNDLSFARIGYVSDSEAKLLIREPDLAQLPIFVSIRLHPGEPHQPSAWRSVGGINKLSNDTDYTAVLHIPLMHNYGETEYEWTTSTGHSGFFISPPAPGVVTQRNDGKFTFVTSSCIIPHFPYSPTDHALNIPGFRYLAKILPSVGAQFMLFLGDFIYIDVPHRFGASVEDYRQK
jgi:alkaline phosphatase D